MRVLVCGSSGCIGRAVVENLRWRGHGVVETAHRPAAACADGNTPGDVVALDFMQPTSPAVWAARLRALRVDTVVNCVGVLIESPAARFDRVHELGPIELFRGAALAGVGRIVQVSALGVGLCSGEAAAGSEPAYLRSKRHADEAVMALPVDAAVVRPSLVYGPRSRSAELFATLASLPVIALPAGGRQRVQPVHVFEVAEAICRLVERTGSARGVYELGGGDVLSYRDMLSTYRRSQGLGEPIFVSVPVALMRAGALFAERLPQKVFSRDTLRLLERGNVATRDAARVLLGRAPAGLADGLRVTPVRPAVDLQVHLARPVAIASRASLAFLWIYIAAISAWLPERSGVLELLARCGLGGSAGLWALAASCTLNTGLGLATLWRPSVKLYAAQMAAMVGYTLTAAVNVPELTLDHCGPLAKNVPLLFLVATLWLDEAGRPRPARPAGAVAAPRGVGLIGPSSAPC